MGAEGRERFLGLDGLGRGGILAMEVLVVVEGGGDLIRMLCGGARVVVAVGVGE